MKRLKWFQTGGKGRQMKTRSGAEENVSFSLIKGTETVVQVRGDHHLSRKCFCKILNRKRWRLMRGGGGGAHQINFNKKLRILRNNLVGRAGPRPNETKKMFRWSNFKGNLHFFLRSRRKKTIFFDGAELSVPSKKLAFFKKSSSSFLHSKWGER